jgi:hypothetical protein
LPAHTAAPVRGFSKVPQLGPDRSAAVISFKALRFEAPRHLPDRTIQIRFERRKPAGRVVVYYKGERMGEARLLDAVANDRKPNEEAQS